MEEEDNLIDRLTDFIPAAGRDSQIKSTVYQILNDVRKGGNQAVLEKTLEYDRVSLSAHELLIQQEEINNARSCLILKKAMH